MFHHVAGCFEGYLVVATEAHLAGLFLKADVSSSVEASLREHSGAPPHGRSVSICFSLALMIPSIMRTVYPHKPAPYV